MNNAAAQYLREVNKRIICPSSLKKPFLRQLGNEARYYCSSHSNANMAMLSEQFGAPEDVAEEFLSELGEQAVNRCVESRKRLLCLTFGILMTVVFFVLVLGMQTHDLQQTLPHGEFIASITYEGESENEVSWLPLQDTIFSNNISVPSPSAE